MTTKQTMADGFGVRWGGRMAAVAALGVVGVLGASAAPASAAGPLDQATTGQPTECGWLGDGVPFAQTFTAGVTGGLDGVTVWLGRGSHAPVTPVEIEIRNVVDGEPGATVLGTTSVPGSSVSIDDASPVTVDVASVPVVAGTQYALVVISDAVAFPPAHCFEGFRQGEDVYVGGEAFVEFEGTWYSLVSFGDVDDFAFETYVTPAPPPPPPPAQPNGLVSGLLGAVTGLLPVLAPIVNPIRGLLGVLGL